MKPKVIVLAGALSGTAVFGQSGSAEDLLGHLTLDARLRFESAEQETLNSSDALTARARLGYQSDTVNGFDFFVEAEATQALDEDAFDAYPGAQGIAGHPVIADGDTFELNRAQVKYASEEGLTSVIGRQRIILDNARFVGNVGWRQNEQTFDAVTLLYAPDDNLSLYGAYVDRVNRIFGSEATVGAQRTLDLDGIILNASASVSESAKLGFYFYGLGIEDAPALSSDTFGLYYTDAFELGGGTKLTTRVEYATQDDNDDSSIVRDYSNDYLHLAVTAKQDALSGGLGYEVLGGNGDLGFSTPLATLHAFNGWADAFLATPANGLEDLYVWGGYAFDKNTSAKLVYHQFDAESGGASYATEWDAVLTYKVNDATKLTAKYAFYNGKGGAPGALKLDRTKFWLSVDYKY